MNLTGLASFVLALGVLIAWLVTKFFVLTNLLAVAIAITALTFVRLPNLTVGSVILVLFFIYDIFWVFLSEFIFKKNVMVNVALKLPDLPMVLILPRLMSDSFSLLGLGDIVLPGLLLSFLYRFDSINYIPFRKGYFLVAWIGYVLGMILTLFMVTLLERGQPALLYLVPFTLIPTLVLGYVRGEWKLLFNSPPPTESEDSGTADDEENLLSQSQSTETQYSIE